MFRPLVTPRIKQICPFLGGWIDTRQIGPFVGVAAVARVGQASRIVLIVVDVLFGNDVFNVKSDERCCRLGYLAVFATVSRAFPHDPSCPRIHFNQLV